MKRILSIILLLALSLAATAQRVPVEGWQLQHEGRGIACTVPGCVHTDLMAAGLIPDPYLLSNEDSVQWVGQREWIYTCSFAVPEELRKQKGLELVFDGLETYAEVAIGGEVMLRADNMFRQWRIPLSEQRLRECNNQLEISVRFSPTLPRDEAAMAALGYTLPEVRAFTRTAPYQQGWDWGPILPTCGIWQPVYLEGRAPKAEEPPYAKLFPYRNVHLRQNEDATGQEFTFCVGREPLFVKGANWIPVHAFPTLDEAQKERYRWLLRSAKEANFNMIRVWGGGIYEPDFFYDLCDSLGLMVWTDFNFSCALYPDHPDFLENVRVEAEEQVKRLSRHPCVVLFCGNNEVHNGWQDWGWAKQYGWTEAQQAEIKRAMDTLFGYNGVLHQAVQKYAPQVDYHPSSPTWGWGHPECVTHGDSHYWGIWHGDLPFEMFQEKTGRFMSEYGFMSYPEMSTVNYWTQNQVSPEANAAEALELPIMHTHQRTGRGTQIIDKALMQYYGVESQELTLEQYVYYTQLVQAYGTGLGITAHRLRQPHCMGTLYWQLNDCWPVASWSSLDYFGNWKALHYRARDLYRDCVILTERITDTTFRARFDGVPLGKHYLSTLEYITFAGEEHLVGSSEMHYAHPRHATDNLSWWSTGKTVGLPRQYNPRKGYLRLRLYTVNGRERTLQAEQLHFMTLPKELQLPKAKVETKITKRKGGEFRVTVTCPVLVKDLQLTASLPGHFSDNYFDLQPGEKRTVTFQAHDPNARELTVDLRCLNPMEEKFIEKQ